MTSEESPTRVLVVDDEPSIRELVQTVLRYEGFEVATAADGRSALTELERFRPDLVVLDVMLPDLDGFEVQQRLSRRRAPRPGGVPHRHGRGRGPRARADARR